MSFMQGASYFRMQDCYVDMRLLTSARQSEVRWFREAVATGGQPTDPEIRKAMLARIDLNLEDGDYLEKTGPIRFLRVCWSSDS